LSGYIKCGQIYEKKTKKIIMKYIMHEFQGSTITGGEENMAFSYKYMLRTSMGLGLQEKETGAISPITGNQAS
jgi:hypothetical protein